MTLNPSATTLNPEMVATGLAFPQIREQDDKRRIFAEYAILGGMLQAIPRFIESGANVDFTHPMSEAIARACVDAWQHHGAETDEAWRCHCSAFLARYTGRSPLLDRAMLNWIAYLMAIHEAQFPPAEGEGHQGGSLLASLKAIEVAE